MRGLWVGPTITVAYITLWYNFIIWRMDWKGLIREIKERSAKEELVRKQLSFERQQSEQADDSFKKDSLN